MESAWLAAADGQDRSRWSASIVDTPDASPAPSRDARARGPTALAGAARAAPASTPGRRRLRDRRGRCWPARGPSAPASSGPSTSSTARSTATARPSTCAARSCTTPTSCAIWSGAARSSSTRSTRCPRAASRSRRPRRRPGGPRRGRGRATSRSSTRPARWSRRCTAEVRRYAGRGDTVFLIGHADHEEVVGTLGEAPEHVVVVADAAEAARVAPRDPPRVAYVTQTTLAVDEAERDRRRAARPLPGARGPGPRRHLLRHQNRQEAVRAIARDCDLVLVVGSANSSNSIRLVEVAERRGQRRPVSSTTPARSTWPVAGARRSASPPARRRRRSSSTTWSPPSPASAR